MSRIYDVVVMGCGASGLAALRRLHEGGASVIGLESAARIGGRIHSAPFADNVVDLGAQWCHGEKDNVVYALVKDLDVLGRQKPDEQVFVLSNGHLLDKDACETLRKRCDQILEDSDKQGTVQSLPDHLNSKFNEGSNNDKDPKWASSYLEWYKKFIHCENSTDSSKVKSLRGLAEGGPCDGEFLLNWKDRGYKTLLDVLLKRYPKLDEELPIEIVLNKEVTNITWSSKENATGLNSCVQIQCNDGSLLAAKHVIVTASIGVLKERHTTLFTPRLPKEKIDTIEALEMVILDKIYLKFDDQWWPTTPCYISLLWRNEDKENLAPEDKWLSEIFALSTVEYQPNVLCAWIYGEGAKHMESLSEEEVQQGMHKVLKVLDSTHKVTPFTDLLRTKWNTNKLARGSYSYRSVNSEVNNIGAIQLSEPLCNSQGAPLVCFAGEATSHHRHSAVHGAVEAGFREADRILSYIRR